MARISFITPVATYHRHREAHVRAQVNAQSVPCEHIVVLDHDGQGAGWARNRALERVTTEFVVFLDADDEISPFWAAACLEVFERAGNSRYVYTDWYEGSRYVAAPDCAWANKTFHPITALVPTSWVRAVGGFDESLPGGEDTALYLSMVTQGFCGTRLNSALFRYVGGGLRSNAFVHSADYQSVMSDIVKKYGGRMACCADHIPLPQNASNQPSEGDVLAKTLWGGNRGERGLATGRSYPRGGNGSLMWVSPSDIAMAPHLWRVYEEPSFPETKAPEIERLGRLFGNYAPRVIDPTFLPRPAAPDLQDILTRSRKRKPVEFPTGQRIGDWNLDAWTLTIALEHAPASGRVLTAGAGNIGFYCVEFDKLGYTVEVVEPQPSPELLSAIADTDIELISAALAPTSGVVRFYINTTDPNVSSIRPEHWGISDAASVVDVSAITYEDLAQRKSSPFAIVQLDIEGSESDILPYVAKFPPAVLIYEYGGGDIKATMGGNWAPAFQEKAALAFELLREHYSRGAIVDAAHKAIYEFAVDDVPEGAFAGLFHEQSAFGNIVLWRQ